MGYKKIVIEQSDHDEDNHYVPNRGEAFSMGMVSGWESANKVFPFILLIVLMVMLFIC